MITGAVFQIAAVSHHSLPCKSAALELAAKYPYECWHCRACVKDCPKDAITMRYPLSHMMFAMEIPEEKKN